MASELSLGTGDDFTARLGSRALSMLSRQRGACSRCHIELVFTNRRFASSRCRRPSSKTRAFVRHSSTDIDLRRQLPRPAGADQRASASPFQRTAHPRPRSGFSRARRRATRARVVFAASKSPSASSCAKTWHTGWTADVHIGVIRTPCGSSTTWQRGRANARPCGTVSSRFLDAPRQIECEEPCTSDVPVKSSAPDVSRTRGERVRSEMLRVARGSRRRV